MRDNSSWRGVRTGSVAAAPWEGEIVWEYVNPFFGEPLFGGPPSSESNQSIRALRYSAEEIARAQSSG